MLGSLLIANRGEIARRIIRTARRLGVRTIAVHSDADASAPFVREADTAVHIGPAAARDSYLRADRILAAARATGAAAIHPGYGFLSENADFAQSVIDAGLIWVGPPPSAITAMGLKDKAKARMIAAGVPVTPGYLGADQSEARLQAEADAIGYPVLIKAVAGGGGKGMRKVERAEDFAAALASCRREAQASFGDDRVLLETYVARPRHLEVQVFGDRFGHVVHLYERDCSLQRRHQKVVEEAPAPGMTPEARAAITEAAVRAARAVAYEGAGTVEFIADASEGLRADRIWFMEMNTRLQVEHPVTEQVTGQDLVEWQLRVASGEPLPLAQDQIPLNGWAMEARLYAENPATGFLPSIGVLDHFVLPDSVRVDTGVEAGGEISAHYDPMIAKLISWGADRATAAARLAAACAAVEVWPVRTNAGFLSRLVADPAFVAGEVDTRFIEANQAALVAPPPPGLATLSAVGQSFRPAPDGGPWTSLEGFRINAPPGWRQTLICGGATFEVGLGAEAPGESHGTGVAARATHTVLSPRNETRVAFDRGEAFLFEAAAAQYGQDDPVSDGVLLAPMPGRIVTVSVKDGDSIRRGQPVLVLEAMKMEHVLTAPFDAQVSLNSVNTGDQVTEGQVLARLIPEEH
jgi:3-methylcrotonyl-CoA carboxylase alpha subunit